MKMAGGVAVVAAVVGAATVGISQEVVQNWLKPIVAVVVVAFAAHILLKMLQIMQDLQQDLKWILFECSHIEKRNAALSCDLKWVAEKCSHIERRMEAAAAGSGDMCRHLQHVLLEFNADLLAGNEEAVKWWWVDRRLRALYEDFSNCKAMEKCNFAMVKTAWSLLQLEVQMRTLRDVVRFRHSGRELTEPEEDMERCLKNMQNAAQFCSFWQPMEVQCMEQHEVQSCFEEIRLAQIKERLKEVKMLIAGDKMQKYEGLQLECILAGSSTG